MLLVRLSPRITNKTFLVSFRQKHGGLACRVPASGDDHGGVTAQLPFHGRGRVVDSQALEAFPAFRFDAVILGTRGDQDTFGQQSRLAPFDLQFRSILALSKPERQGLRRRRKLRPKAVGL